MEPHLYIFGDSYLDSIHISEYGKILTDNFIIHNHALSSSSEYRIYNTFLSNKDNLIKKNHYYLIGHTTSTRLYTPEKPIDITGYDKLEKIYGKGYEKLYYDLLHPQYYWDFIYKSIGKHYDIEFKDSNNVIHFYWHKNPSYICKSGKSIHINQFDKNYNFYKDRHKSFNHMEPILINKLLSFIKKEFLYE